MQPSLHILTWKFILSLRYVHSLQQLSNEKARNDISIISIPEDGIKQLDQISRSLRGSGLEKVESSTVPKAADDSDDGGSEDIARKNNVESSDAKKSGEDMAMTVSPFLFFLP